jgi:hypothetical protein
MPRTGYSSYAESDMKSEDTEFEILVKEGTLVCPNCGFDYLHHEQVQIFNRQKEDSVTGIYLGIMGTNVAIDTTAERENPSLRRNGLRITFWCEGCDKKPVLVLAQHKGQTFIHMEIL